MKTTRFMVFLMLCAFSASMLLTGCQEKKSEPTDGDKPAVESTDGGEEAAAPAEEAAAPAEEAAPVAPAEEAAAPAEEAAPVAPAEEAAAPAEEAASVAPAEEAAAPAAEGEFSSDDLTACIEDALEDIKGDLETDQLYEKSSEIIVRTANVLCVLCVAASNSAACKYKAAAPAMLKAAQQLAASTDSASAQAAATALDAATASDSTETLEWVKVADLQQLMKAVPSIDSKVKLFLRSESTLVKRGMTSVPQNCTELAVIGKGALANSADTIKPEAVTEWKLFNDEYVAASLGLRAKVLGLGEGTATFDEVKAAYTELEDTCNKCHEIFKPADPAAETTEEAATE